MHKQNNILYLHYNKQTIKTNKIMAVIRLTMCTYDRNNGKVTPTEDILFQTDRMIKAKTILDYYSGVLEKPITHITHVEAMVNGFTCMESIEYIEELIKTNN